VKNPKIIGVTFEACETNNPEYAIVSSITVTNAVINPNEINLKNLFVETLFIWESFFLISFFGLSVNKLNWIDIAKRKINPAEMKFT